MKKQEANKTFFFKEWLIKNREYNSNLINNDISLKKLKRKRVDLLFFLDEENKYSSTYAIIEIKDEASYNDKNWKDAYNQAYEKAKLLNLPFFCIISLWNNNPEDHKFWLYNTSTLKKITLNGRNVEKIPKFDTFYFIFQEVKNKNTKNNVEVENYLIKKDVDSSRFDDLLLTLRNKYRNFFIDDEKNETQPIIDLSISLFVSKIFYEINKENEKSSKKLNLDFNWKEIRRKNVIKDLTDIFSEVLKCFQKDRHIDKDLDVIFNTAKKILEQNKNKKDIVLEIYDLINSFGNFRNIDIDIYGSIYEMFASKQVKSSFGKYFTKRNYTKFFSDILINNINLNNINEDYKILDPFCGTGGFLSEIFKNLKNIIPEKKDIIKEIIYGWDKSKKSISLTKINMYIIGDGHTNIKDRDSFDLKEEEISSFDLIITNPPYGKGVKYWKEENIKTQWMEKLALRNIVKWLKPGGIASVVLPLSFMENEKDIEIRKWFLSKVNLKYILQMNEFAFSPYTKTETVNLIFTKKINEQDKTKNVYMYKIHFDGFYNSDKRFKTLIKDENNKPIHDELSRWNDNDKKIQNSYAEKQLINCRDIENFGYYDLKWNWKQDNFKAKNINIIEIENNDYKLVPKSYLNQSNLNLKKESPRKILKNVSKIINLNKKNNYDIDDIEIDGNKKISDLFLCEKRSDVLTEEFIYSKGQKLLNEKSSLKILSANTSGEFYGEIPISIIEKKHPMLTQGKYKLVSIKSYKGKGLHVPTAGQVGYVKALLKDDYYATTTAARIIRFNNKMKEYYEENEMLDEAYKFYEKEISILINNYKKDSKRGGIAISTFFNDSNINIPLLKSTSKNKKVLKEILKLDEQLSKIKNLLDKK